mmetsp:Transcript_19747/g.34689  ORF Transcript_19747/g.34689 Transcript_19747/m.34689 type:complete len:341 (+) Transcript_19747:363-1385(+)
MYLVSRYSSSPSWAPSLPSPDSFTPPNGVHSRLIIPSFNPTIPTSSRSATRQARPMSRVQKYAASPFSVAFASATASSSLSNVRRPTTGPKISSPQHCISSVTCASNVGSKKLPPFPCSSPRRCPPATSWAPLLRASCTRRSTLSTAAPLISGPTVTPRARPSPTRSRAIAAASFPWKASARARCTRKRFGATQVWPALRNLAAIAAATAPSRSASSKTRKGALPPSSSDTRFTVGAACAMSSLPTSVEPVKLIFRTRGSPHRAQPAAAAPARSVVTTLNSPFGNPARPASSPSASAVSGVSSEGLTMVAHPAASAGATFLVIIAAGKFHGVIIAATPTG